MYFPLDSGKKKKLKYHLLPFTYVLSCQFLTPLVFWNFVAFFASYRRRCPHKKQSRWPKASSVAKGYIRKRSRLVPLPMAPCSTLHCCFLIIFFPLLHSHSHAPIYFLQPAFFKLLSRTTRWYNTLLFVRSHLVIPQLCHLVIMYALKWQLC